MNRKSKALGLALFAVFALSAMTASSASAAGELFHSDGDHTILDATQDGAEGSETGRPTFHTTVGKLTCKGVHAEVTITETTPSQITAKPTYTNCQGLGLTTHVHMNTCDFLFTSEKVDSDAPVHIKCEKLGDEIEIKATFLGSEVNCVDVPAQTPTGGGVVYHEHVVGAKIRTLTIEATVKGIEYTETGSCGSKVANDGEYTGNVLIEGTNTNKEETDIWWK